MIYDSPRSYQPEIDSPIGTLALSNSIIRQGAKVGDKVYTIPSLVDSTIISTSITPQLREGHYKETVVYFTKQSTVDTAWAAANNGYTTLVVASELFDNDFQYQTNLRVIDSQEMILYKSVHVFLNSQSEFLPPRKIDVIHPPPPLVEEYDPFSVEDYNPSSVEAYDLNWLSLAQFYDVVIVDTPFNFELSSVPGLLSIFIGTNESYPGYVRIPNTATSTSNVEAFELKRQSIVSRLL